MTDFATTITLADLDRVAAEYDWTRVHVKGRVGWFRLDGYVAVLHDEDGRLTEASSDFGLLGLDGVALEAAVFDRLATPEKATR